MVRRRVVHAAESGLRTLAWIGGKGRFAPASSYFGPRGLEEAEALCEEANRDFAAFLRPSAVAEVAGLVIGRPVPLSGGGTLQHLAFDSPRESGRRGNDRVSVRVLRPPGGGSRGVVFHHPLRQDSWAAWDWFLHGVARRVPVAMMTGPHHFERALHDRFAGEWTCNPNPWRLFEALRQWMADEAATRSVLASACGFETAALMGYSLGAFQSLLAGSFGFHDLPLVSVACTNRYAHGVFHGALSGTLRRGMREVGIDEARLARMTRAIELERWVGALHGRPVLLVYGEHDPVDPPPSLDRLRDALRPTRAVRLRAGHATMLLARRTVEEEALRFLAEVGVT